jgi:uncharacterized protein (DUF433 family)
MALAHKHLIHKGTGVTEIAGRGVRVYTILGLRESGDSPEVIAEAYRLPMGAVYEALAYAANHPEEMEAIHQAELAVEREVLMALPAELRRGIDIP